MLKQVLSSKLHNAVVTHASVHYEGSLTIDRDLMDAVGLSPYEKILVGVQDNGNRFETYAIEGARGSRIIALNGAVAHLGKIGHQLTIMSFTLLTPAELKSHKPRIAVLDRTNHILVTKNSAAATPGTQPKTAKKAPAKARPVRK